MKLQYTKSNGLLGLNPKEARVIGRALQAIQQSESVITPKRVVAIARNPRSPLHKYFEWDDSVASEKYREWQARYLICSVKIVDSSSDKAHAIRAFVNVAPEDEADDFMAGRGYVAVASLRGRQNYEAQVLQYAKNQLIGWKSRFGHYKEFFGVTAEIEKLN